MGPRGLDCNFSSLIFPFGMCLDPVVCVIRPSERPSGNLEFGNKSRFPVFFPNTVEPEFDGHMSSKEVLMSLSVADDDATTITIHSSYGIVAILHCFQFLVPN